MHQSPLSIGNRPIGAGYPTYIIAELSANHNQSLEQALALINAAKEAQVDAIKLQTYTPDTLTIDSHKPWFQITGTPWAGRNLYDLYQEAFTPWEWYPILQAHAQQLGLDIFSSPFDDTAVAFLEQYNPPAYKIASFENVDIPLIKTIARTGKPVIMSTGMANLAEIAEAVATFYNAGGTALSLLKCTSAYPASPDTMNLRTIPHLAAAFQIPVGLSDHTLGIGAAIAAVSLGACIVEKHLTLSRQIPGPDSSFSLEPHEFKELVNNIRLVEQALGTVRYDRTAEEEKSIVFRRSLFVTADIQAGEVFTLENVRSIRPGHGLHTRYLPEVLGRKATTAIEKGTPLSWALIG